VFDCKTLSIKESKMYIILEFIGTDGPHSFLGSNGLPLQFNTLEQATLFAVENCAFDFQIVELRGGTA